jgi:hypothetical protein
MFLPIQGTDAGFVIIFRLKHGKPLWKCKDNGSELSLGEGWHLVINNQKKL